MAGGTGSVSVPSGASAATIGSVIAGSNTGLQLSGGGALTLNGANSYSGVTTISSGALQIGSGGMSGSLGSGNVTDNAALKFDRSDSVAVSNVISGTGSLAQIGSGTVALTGA